MAAAKNRANDLDDKYSSEAAESMPFAKLVEAPSSVGSLYGLPRLHTSRHVCDNNWFLCRSLEEITLSQVHLLRVVTRMRVIRLKARC